MRTYLTVAAAIALTLAAAPAAAAGDTHLFIDNDNVAAGTYTRTFHQPRKTGLVLSTTDFTTPATLEANGSILWNGREWVMYALGYSSSAPTDRTRLYRFTSRDGTTWSSGTRVTFGYPHDMFSAYYDHTDAAYPYKGWVFRPNIGDTLEGTYLVRSADGITWDTAGQVTNAFAGGSDPTSWDIGAVSGPGDVTTFSHDPVTGRFLASFKFFNRAPAGPFANRARSRAYGWTGSLDAASVPDALAFTPDTAGPDEFYSSTGWRYADMFLGTLKVYSNATGQADLRFISSRDGLKWRNHGRFLTNAAEGGGDGGYMTEFSTPPLRVGRELLFYYGASAWGKLQPDDRRVTGGGVFLARLRVDGFASLRGSWTTRPLRFRGSVRVNFRGRVTVSVLSGGRVVGSRTLTGDSVAARVRVPLPARGQLRFQGGAVFSYTTG